eukprot:9442-Heterococcus_DN1.PRE.2
MLSLVCHSSKAATATTTAANLLYFTALIHTLRCPRVAAAAAAATRIRLYDCNVRDQCVVDLSTITAIALSMVATRAATFAGYATTSTTLMLLLVAIAYRQPVVGVVASSSSSSTSFSRTVS